jgi:hypothetical protein
MSEPVVHAEGETETYDIALVQVEEGRMDVKPVALDRVTGGEVGKPLERLDELRAAIGVAGVVHRVHPHEEVAGADVLGQGQGMAPPMSSTRSALGTVPSPVRAEWTVSEIGRRTTR